MGIIKQSLQDRTKKDQVGENVAPATNGGKNNLVKLFLDHAVHDSETDRSEVDLKTLRDFVIGFFMAGRDTTAESLSWFFYCISRHPEAEQAIIQEMKEKCPRLFENSDEFTCPSMEEVQQLWYLEAAIKETLRLYPSLPQNTRKVACDTMLSDGVLVPEGGYILLATYALGRLESVWGPDAKEF